MTEYLRMKGTKHQGEGLNSIISLGYVEERFYEITMTEAYRGESSMTIIHISKHQAEELAKALTEHLRE